MCGIVAYFSDSVAMQRTAFIRMVESLKTRGPDGDGASFFNQDRVALGHARLSIIDLSDAGAQPMCNEDETVWLTYNGELYNHLSLRGELIDLGHVYKSMSDSETIIHAWEEWGNECVLRFQGIFAFCIWDTKNDRIFCARDHFGVKPLFYSQTSKSLCIASQPRAILQQPDFLASANKSAFADYLFYGVVPHDRSIFSSVNKLAPGHCLVYQDGKLTISRYWQAKFQPEIYDFEEAREALDLALTQAVSDQLMSDVPVATFLSGGIDSSLITSMACKLSDTKITSLSLGFSERAQNELPFARRLAEHAGTSHRESVLSFSRARHLLKNQAEVHDEPFALGAAIPLMQISSFAKEQQQKVILAGDGADELLAGYLHYDEAAQHGADFLRYRPHESLLHLEQELRVISKEVMEACEDGPKWRYQKFIGQTGNPVRDTQLLDINSYLPDENLIKVDRASMFNGVEVRVPFLDQKLAQTIFKIDHSILYRSGERKALLKEVAKDWLPPDLITRRKKGFSIPARRWIMRPHHWLEMYLTLRNGALAGYNLIDGDRFNKTGLTLPHFYLWKLYVAELWARRWLSTQ